MCMWFTALTGHKEVWGRPRCSFWLYRQPSLKTAEAGPPGLTLHVPVGEFSPLSGLGPVGPEQ